MTGRPPVTEYRCLVGDRVVWVPRDPEARDGWAPIAWAAVQAAEIAGVSAAEVLINKGVCRVERTPTHWVVTWRGRRLRVPLCEDVP